VRRILKSVLSSALFQVLFVIPIVGVAFFAASRSGLVPFMTQFSAGGAIAVSVLVGAIAFCRSPSVTLAVLAETRSKGPLSEWALGVCVLLDVAILPVFAAALAYVRSEINGDPFSVDMFVHIGSELIASMIAGVTFGLLVAVLFRLVTTERILVVVVLSYALTALCVYLQYDTLLVFVVAGFIVQNLTRGGHALVETSEKTSAAVMVVFFATAGAKLDLGALKSLWAVVLVIFIARVASTYVGARVGHRVARDQPAVSNNAWLVLISQAGITIGLATVAAEAVPNLGASFASMIVAVVAVNELLGAALTKWAVTRAGEVPSEPPQRRGDH
jgi:Kef-type K+ transport system membrane component KefB